MATANDFTIRLPDVTSNVLNESPLASLLRRRALLDPMSQSMWDADPRNQAEITRLRREEAGLSPVGTPNDQTTFEDIFGPPPEVPPGTDTTAALVSWLNTLTPAKRAQWATSPRTSGMIKALNSEGYSIDTNGILNTPSVVPPAAPPSRPGTIVDGRINGQYWDNPDAVAPRGYNPELWAQREIGPNRTYSGGITGTGIGGPRNPDGTAMYAPPPEVRATRGINPFGYEPAPRKPAEFSGFTLGEDGFYRSDRGGASAYDENLLTTLKAAADAGEGRANYILSSLSTGADQMRPVFSAKMNQYGVNPIDNYAAQYDWEQEVLQKKDIARKVKQGWTFDEDRMLVPPDGWIQEDNGSWRPPEDAGWTNIGGRWFPPERNSTKQSAAPTPPGWTSIGGRYSPKQSPAPTPPNEQNKEESDMPKNPFMPRMASGTVVPPGPRAAQEILRAQAQRARDANGIGGLAPTPGPRAAQEILRAAAQRQMDAANPFMSSFAESTRRMPVYTMPSERVPMPMQRGPAVPGRLPIQLGPVAGPLTIGSRPVVAPAPNPFLGGGATRGYRNPFR